MADDTDIAVVGIGCRFPGADNINEFWRVLVNGENHVVDIPADRWDKEGFYDPDPNAQGKSYVKRAGFVKGLDYWDNTFFGVNDVEAKAMDPQQRLVLECVHMALENGGITRQEIDGSSTGVYIGAMNDDFGFVATDDSTIGSNYKVTGIQRSIISARVSYVYNLSGPAMTIDTACSSALVAVHIGSQALRLGDCSTAICGGVNCLLDPAMFVALSKARMLSPTAQCQAFTDQADGYARGEGCGIVILKRLKDALRDENEIWGIVRTATNQDGHTTTPITAPSGKQQVALLEMLYDRFSAHKNNMQVIEAHGTGTAIGDPTEASSLGRFFDITGSKNKSTIFIGSCKTNIGHLESAAGVAGLIKILLMMKHKTIVPSLMYTESNENPKIHFSRFGLKVPTTCHDWKTESTCRTACVNSFGFGGSNAHAIVTEFISEQKARPYSVDTFPSLVALSAVNKSSLVTNIASLNEALVHNAEDVNSVAFTSQLKRDHYKYRKAFPVKSTSELKEKLTKVSTTEIHPVKKRCVNFVFCGVGTAWSGMCTKLMTNPIFNKAIKDVDICLQQHTGWSVFDMFVAGFSDTSDPLKSHIAIFACQVGLDALWKAIGIVPNAVIGQSVGEVAAAYSAGYMDLSSAVDLIYYRSATLAIVKKGTMVVVKNIDIHEVETLCTNKDKEGSVNIAVFNSPKSCTLAGSAEDIQNICNDITHHFKEAVVIPLEVHCAYHSKYVADAAQKFGAQVERIQMTPKAAKSTSFFSTVTGVTEKCDVVNSAQYWINNVLMPVKFGEAIEKSTQGLENIVFLEIGPNPVLRSHISSIFHSTENTPLSVPSMAKGKEAETFVATLCTLYELGVDPLWTALYPCRGKLATLPTYAFVKKKHDLPKANVTSKQSTDSSTSHLFMKKIVDDNGEIQISLNIDPKATAFVFQHRVKKNVVVPGAMYADAAFFIGKYFFHTNAQNLDISLQFLTLSVLPENASVVLKCKVRPINQSEIEFVIKDGIVAKCKGRIKQSRKTASKKRTLIGIDAIERRLCHEKCQTFNKNDIYSILEKSGFKYGSSLTMLESCVSTSSECLVDMIVPESVWKDVDKTMLHPCILDCALQSSFFGFNVDKIPKSFLPAGIESIQINGHPEREMKVYCKRTKVTEMDTTYQIHFDIYILNTKDEVLFTVSNFTSYLRKNAWKVPVELAYDMRLLPFEAKIIPQIHENNLVILTDEQNEERIDKLQTAKNVRMVSLSSQFNLADMPLEELDINDVIILMFSDKTAKDVLTSPMKIYERVRDNCWILTQLIQLLNQLPVSVTLVVTTQNTQTFTKDECTTDMNIFGSEVWGFTRSAQIEFALKNITLVDLQSPLNASLDTFLSYMKSLPRDASHPREIIFRESCLFYPDLHNIASSTLCPDKRLTLVKRQKCTDAINGCVVFQHNPEQQAYVCVDNGTPPCTSISSDTTKIYVQDVFLHPKFLYEESPEDDSLVAIEYTGIKIDTRSNAFPQCKSHSIDPGELNFEDRLHHVIVFPAKIQPILEVPRACTISEPRIPDYKPGLLSYALIFWEMVQQVPHKSTCKIISGNTPFENILRCMLVSLKQATIEKEEGNVDVVILLTKKQKVVYDIWKAKVVIALPNTLSMTQTRMLDAGRGKLFVCGFEKVLSKTMIPKHLNKVIKWLQKNQTLLSNYNETDSTTQHIKIAEGDKLVLPCIKYSNNLFDEKSVYVVTGGLTGLGWEIVNLILDMGARKIVTLSRREQSRDQSNAIQSLSKKYECSIVHIPTDASDLESVQNAVDRISNTIGPLKGIFHCSGILDSKPVIKMDFAGLENVLKPKVLGALNLYFATRSKDLEHFQLISSINSVIGSLGQSNYGAANNFLDAFAFYLRRVGVCCQSVRWGALDLGMVKNNKMDDFFKKHGHRPLSVPEIRSCVEFQLLTNCSGLIFADLDWNAVAYTYTNSQMQTLVHKLKTSFEDHTTREIKFSDKETIYTFNKEEIVNADLETQMTALYGLLEKAAATIMRSDEDHISLSTKVFDLGFDSMSSLTFLNIVNDATGCQVPLNILEGEMTTFRDLAEYLHGNIFADVHYSSSYL